MKDEVIVKSLQALATLKVGDKISSRKGYLTKDETPKSFKRWLNGDSRAATIAISTQIISSSFVSLNPTVASLIVLLPESLENLKLTYVGDNTMCTAVNLLLDQIKQYLS